MSAAWIAVGQVLILVVALAAVHVPLGGYMAWALASPKHLRIERVGYRTLRVDPDADQRWSTYLLSVLGFSLASVLVLYGLERLQDRLPLSLGFAPMDPAGAWNTAVSFTTNTNWQWYSGEAAAGHLLQMAGLAVQNFLSAAVGIAVVVALIRGFARSQADGRVGNFWFDLTRTVVRVLLPVAFMFAIVLIAMGHGDPGRSGRQCPVRRLDHLDVDRRGELDARLADRPGRRDRAVEHGPHARGPRRATGQRSPPLPRVGEHGGRPPTPRPIAPGWAG